MPAQSNSLNFLLDLKWNSTQYALLNLIESWKKRDNNNVYSAAVLMDLSKPFDTINNDLLLAKLHAYGVSANALKDNLKVL